MQAFLLMRGTVPEPGSRRFIANGASVEYPTFYDDTVRRRLMDAEGYLWNPYGKTASSRRKVRLNSVAVEVIKRRMKAAKGLYLFPTRRTKTNPR